MQPLSFATIVLIGSSMMFGLAQAASPMADTGARPGHEPGVGTSLPRSNCSVVIGDDATTQEYLRSARASLAAGSTCEAQQSLAMAETRALTRSVVATQAEAPDSSQIVAQIEDARHMLNTGDKAQTIRLIDVALSN